MERGESTFLGADDEIMLCRILATMLVGDGRGKVLQASKGQEALAILESTQVDVLITDIRMPIMDGVTLVRKLAARGSRWPGRVMCVGSLLTTVPSASRSPLLNPLVASGSRRRSRRCDRLAISPTNRPLRTLRRFSRGADLVRGTFPGNLDEFSFV
jgi:CheY-like chemotaxis protein